MQVWSAIVDALTRHGACALVTQLEVQGSAPREAGARMVVMPDGTFTGTIGGGALEWHVLARAQKLLRNDAAGYEITRHALGPGMGQCCGGAVQIMIEVWQAGRLEEARTLADAEITAPFATRTTLSGGQVVRIVSEGEGCGSGSVEWESSGNLIERFGHRNTAVFLFGAGHVGRALMLALAPLPFEVTWIDERREVFPAAVPGNVTMVASRDPATQLAAAPDGAMVIAMTHSHARDFEIVETALAHGRFSYVGVIGSKTKRARFSSRMRKAGLGEHTISQLVCPIGVAEIASKAPASIAASVAAQLLQRDELVKTGQKPVQISSQGFTMADGQERAGARRASGRGD